MEEINASYVLSYIHIIIVILSCSMYVIDVLKKTVYVLVNIKNQLQIVSE